MAKFTFKEGEKPVVSIPIPKKSGKGIQRGLIVDEEPVYYLKRRTSQPQTVYLKVFDAVTAFSQESDTTTGSFILTVGQEVQYINNFPPTTANEITASGVEITDVLADYDISFPEFGAYVADLGLPKNMVGGLLEADSSGGYFWDWDTGYKVTMSASYGAEEVSFSFDKDCDVYLAPLLYFMNGDAHTEYEVYPLTFWAIHGLLIPLSRATVNDSDWETLWANRGNPTAHSSGTRSYFKSFVTSVTDMFTGTVPVIIPSRPASIPGVSETSASGFPSTGGDTFAVLGMSVANIAEGTLMAIIVKHLNEEDVEYYYVWSPNDQSMSLSNARIVLTEV